MCTCTNAGMYKGDVCVCVCMEVYTKMYTVQTHRHTFTFIWSIIKMFWGLIIHR